MVVSVNSENSQNDFNALLNATLLQLDFHARKSTRKVMQLQGQRLEPYVRDIMKEMAINTPFEGSIELIGGQKFPDIIAKKYYGVEVKTTKQNHWKTTGNSVLESTRVGDVKRIFLLFCKTSSSDRVSL